MPVSRVATGPSTSRSAAAAAVVVAVVVAVPGLVHGIETPAEPPPNPVVREFGEAVTAHRDGRLDEAIERIRRVLDMDRDDPDALWNLGLWTAESGRREDALDAWLRYAEVAPGDWRVRAKLVQAYQALERNADRDRERETLRASWRERTDRSLSATAAFCRDQFVVDGREVYAMEFFAPAGNRPVTIEFRVLAGDGTSEAAYRLASWDDHNPVAWDDTPNSRVERTYHLARTSRGGRAMVAWYQGEPPYERVRRQVITDLEQRAARDRR